MLAPKETMSCSSRFSASRRAPLRGPDDGLHYPGLDLHALVVAEFLEPALDGALAETAEVEALAAGYDSDGEPVSFGCGENEDYVPWRLLQNLEEGVEGGSGHHMDFVDNIDLEGRLGGQVVDALP